MLRRFVAAAAVASVAIACAAFGTLLITGFSLRRAYPLALLWCLLPAIWGAWALAAPAAWVPRRLPAWGTMLGVIAGVFGAFVLNLPLRIFDRVVPGALRLLGVVLVGVLYYVLWMIVRAVYDHLSPARSDLPAASLGGPAAAHEPCSQAAQHVSDAYALLGNARTSYPRYPELDEAIARLELALSLLTIKTGGML